MEVYFIRHGETNGNVAHRHQLGNTPLTFAGEEQAREAAKMVSQNQPTHLLSSKLLRAIETAKVIGKECDLIPETSEYFVELDRPKYLYGQHHTSPRSFIYYAQWYLGLGLGDKRGESYRSFRARIEKAKKQLQTYPDDARVVVVSHAVFINFFIAHLCSNRAMAPWTTIKTFYNLLTMQNGEVIKVIYNSSAHERACAWSREQTT